MSQSPKIAVLGGGVVGCTVANMMYEHVRNASITIVADKLYEETTSAVAAGIFTPRSSFRAQQKEITDRWVRDSWDYWLNIYKLSDAPLAGVTQISTYIFSKENPHVVKNAMIDHIVPVFRTVSHEELKLCGGGWKHGSFYTTLLTDCKRYLPWAIDRFTKNGGHIKNRKVSSFNELNQEYDLVFNCTGLGAKELCQDTDLSPIRGQVIKVKAPWVKTGFYGDYDTYIIPGFDGVVTLGGTRQFDSYNLNVCKHDTAAIMERCCQLLPGLKKCQVLAEHVGLRPHRTPVRVEAETTSLVHCYGHGGYGVTMAPGTAKYAVQLACDVLRMKKNKL